MYDPTVGRWMEEDPEGFDAGDSNLMRYVGNDPTNATDPTGLEHEPNLDLLFGVRRPVGATRVDGDKQQPCGMKDSTFRFGRGEGTVSVYTNATVIKQNRAMETDFIQLEFKATVPVTGMHWLQFGWFQEYDLLGHEDPPHEMTIGRPGGKKIRVKSGFDNIFLDTGSTDPRGTDLYYDTSGGTYRRGKNEVSIFDKPLFYPNNQAFGVTKQVWSFLSYLVSEDGQVYYRVYWNVTANYDAISDKWHVDYQVVNGQRADKIDLPVSLDEKKNVYNGGYTIVPGDKPGTSKAGPQIQFELPQFDPRPPLQTK
jgi:uncharacterized protein RhaS with RHS repeats